MNQGAVTLLRLAPLLLVPSGCAALIYQVTWVRLLGLSMGSTSAAVSTVLSAFFLGLAIGSYFAERISRGERADLRAFIGLELAIGICGLALLPVLLQLDHAMALMGGLGSILAVKLAVCLTVLAVPTVCMGATFPVMAAALIRDQHEMGSQVGWLYTLNTLGAVLGALSAGFVLTPWVGLDGAIYVACALNVCVALLGLALHLRFKRSASEATGALTEPGADESPEHETLDGPAEPDALRGRVALVLFFTGFVSIASEVGWTKYLSIFTGATLYGFAAILGIFLSGIALGSWAAKRTLRQRVAAPAVLAWGLALLGASLLFARVGLASLPAVLDFLRELDSPAHLKQGLKYLATFVVLFPATFVFGGLFPITLAMYCARIGELQRRIGRGYAVNTIGSILGALAAGFWIIPYFGTDALLSATVVATLALSWLFLDTHAHSRRRASALALTLLLLAGSWQLPHLDYKELITASPYRFDSDGSAGKQPTFLFLEEGKAGVISVVTYDNKKALLQNNGIQESYLALVPNLSPPFTEVLLAVVPFLLHPSAQPKSAFVVGFGGGNTVQALTDTSLSEIRVVELEPSVVAAVAAIAGGTIPSLQDARVELEISDARNSLLVGGRSYDMIVSQPSHPWLAGAGNLFTQQFFEIARDHLNPDGVFAQWVNLFNMDATTLRAILRAYFETFPHGFVLANTDNGDLLMFGSKQPLLFDYARIEARMRMPRIKRALAVEKVSRPEDLLWYFSLSRDEALTAAADVPANTDTRIVSEVRLAGMTLKPEGEEDPYALLQTHSSLDVLPYLNPNEAARTLYLAGRYFYRHYATTRTRRAISRLESLNPAMATRLEQDWENWRELLRRPASPGPGIRKTQN